MNNDGFTVSVKVFVEDLDLTDNNAYTTGKITEITGWTSVSYTQAASLSKSLSVTIPNNLDILSTSIKYKNKTTVSSDENAAKEYIDEIYTKYANDIVYTNPFRRNKGLTDRYSEFINNSFHCGVIDQEALNVTAIESSGFAVTLMQRIWVLFRTEGLSNTSEDIKYSVVAGIITGISDEYDAEGAAYNIVLKISGLHRLLELSPIHITVPVYNLKDDVTTDIAKYVIKPLMKGAEGYDNIFATLPPSGGYLFALWLTNMMFTYQGYYSDYNNEYKDREHGFFYHEPIWNLPNMPKKPALTQGLYVEKNYNSWITSVQNQLMVTADSNFLTDTTMDRTRNTFIPEALYSGVEIVVADMIPIPVFDPMISLMFYELGVFQKKIRSAFELFAVNTMTASDIITKIATATTSVCYESDSGQIVIEIPKTWRAPHNSKRVDLIKEYELLYEGGLTESFSGEEIGVLDDRGKESYTEDYIIHKKFLKSRSQDHNEANIVTDVEAKANFNFISTEEKIQDLDSTGRVSVDDADKKVLQLQRRFGIRSEQVEPILTNTFSFQTNDGDEKIRLGEMLDKYAESSMNYRNFAQKASTFTTVLLHWLAVNNNLLYAERGELWMITDKSLSYNVNGDYSCSFSTTWGHSLGERLGNPYADAYIYALKNGELLDVISSVPTQKEEEKPATTKSEYEALATKWARHYGLEAAFVKSIIEVESEWVANATSKGDAKGLMQLVKSSGWAEAIKGGAVSSTDDILDPETNIKAGCYYLKWLKNYVGKPKLVVAAYNSGPTPVLRAINDQIGTEFSGTSKASQVKETCLRLTQDQIDSIVNNISSTSSVIGDTETTIYVRKVSSVYLAYGGNKPITGAFNV